MAEEDDKRIESHRFAHFPITTPRCRNLYLSLTSLIIIEIAGYVQINYVLGRVFDTFQFRNGSPPFSNLYNVLSDLTALRTALRT